ncbi:MAG: cysteinyl-tRNA synthetase, partial [Candidatus Omnitrophota bacterium]
DAFTPLADNVVRMYVCGPTVYDEPHIGHLRSAFAFDIIRRVFSETYEVIFVRNVTDVDDKIIVKAKESNQEIAFVTNKYWNEYHRDLVSMDILEPTHEPKATEHIPEMVNMIQALIDKDLAYSQNGNVYFRIRSFESYGALSNQRIDEIQEHQRIDAHPDKEDNLDFALWKSSQPGEPAWDSPWGQGRPGWHIECSAMSKKYLGDEFDIHGGGKDLVFPHHENERSQSMGACGGDFAKAWIHHGLVTIDGRKMSKSVGNFFGLNSFVKKYPVDVLKMFFLQSHYSQDVDFSWDKTEALNRSYESFMHLFSKFDSLGGDTATPDLVANYDSEFWASLRDDFNTSKAMAVLHKAMHEANRLLDQGKLDEAQSTAQWIQKHGQKLSLFNKATNKDDQYAEAIQTIIDVINTKRKERNFEVSDFLRAKLQEFNLHVEDSKMGTSIKNIKNIPEADLVPKLNALLTQSREM